MVVSMILALSACPGMLGTQEAIRQSQQKERREEHRARRCNLIATCVKSSLRSREINGRQVVLRDGKIYIDTGTTDGDPYGHPFGGYYLPYPDETYEGLVTTITEVAPIMNWVYIDKESYELKYGIRKDAQPNFHGPFDCTRQDRRLTFEGWEGFVAVEENPGAWAIYFDKDDDGLRSRIPPGTRVLEIELIRKEKRWKKDTQAREKDQSTSHAASEPQQVGSSPATASPAPSLPDPAIQHPSTKGKEALAEKTILQPTPEPALAELIKGMVRDDGPKKQNAIGEDVLFPQPAMDISPPRSPEMDEAFTRARKEQRLFESDDSGSVSAGSGSPENERVDLTADPPPLSLTPAYYSMVFGPQDPPAIPPLPSPPLPPLPLPHTAPQQGIPDSSKERVNTTSVLRNDIIGILDSMADQPVPLSQDQALPSPVSISGRRGSEPPAMPSIPEERERDPAVHRVSKLPASASREPKRDPSPPAPSRIPRLSPPPGNRSPPIRPSLPPKSSISPKTQQPSTQTPARGRSGTADVAAATTRSTRRKRSNTGDSGGGQDSSGLLATDRAKIVRVTGPSEGPVRRKRSDTAESGGSAKSLSSVQGRPKAAGQSRSKSVRGTATGSGSGSAGGTPKRQQTMKGTSSRKPEMEAPQGAMSSQGARMFVPKSQKSKDAEPKVGISRSTTEPINPRTGRPRGSSEGTRPGKRPWVS